MMRPPKPGLSPNTSSSTILFHISAHERSGNCIKTQADLGNKWIGLPVGRPKTTKETKNKVICFPRPPQTSTPCGVSGSRGIARVSTFGRGKQATICRCIHTDSRLTGERRVSTHRNATGMPEMSLCPSVKAHIYSITPADSIAAPSDNK